MSWFNRKPTPHPSVRQPHAYPRPDDDVAVLAIPSAFACTTCGRTDLPESGDWDPPICLECDAAINEDAIREEAAYENDADDGW